MCLKGFAQSQALGEFLQWHQGTLFPSRAGACAALRREALLPAYRVGQQGAKLACAENDTLGNMPFEVTPEKVAAAMLAADAYGRAALAE